jgi:hypothetical protein
VNGLGFKTLQRPFQRFPNWIVLKYNIPVLCSVDSSERAICELPPVPTGGKNAPLNPSALQELNISLACQKINTPKTIFLV